MYLDVLKKSRSNLESEQSTSQLVQTHSFSTQQVGPASQASAEPPTHQSLSSEPNPPPFNLTALIVCIVVVAVIAFSLKIFTHPSLRGYFCDDDSIRYPLVNRQHVPAVALTVTCCLIPILVFCGVEAVRLLQTSRPPRSWICLLRHFSEVYGVFLFGAGLCKIIVDVGKLTVGRLRPHFLQACKPAESCPPGSHEYVQDYRCTGNPAVVQEARLSFPSGHATLAFYTAVYTGVFLRRRLDARWRIPCLLAQSLLLGAAWFTALSRVKDYMHHPSDVAAGILLGSGWAVFVTCSVSDTRREAREDQEERTNRI